MGWGNFFEYYIFVYVTLKAPALGGLVEVY